MTTRDPLRLDQQLCFALYQAQRALTRAYAPLLEPLGLTYPQYIVMLVLWEHDGLAVKELGERVALDSGTLTPLLKRLELQGVLTRSRSAEDERVVLLHLTAPGRALRARARSVPTEVACRAGFDPTSPRDQKRIEALRSELHALSAQLHRIGETA